jgi:hypothetical protein
VLPDAKLHRPRDHIYFRRLLRDCGFKSYTAAAVGLKMGRRTIARYATDGGFSYELQWYLECLGAIKAAHKSSALLAPKTVLG